jgi:hypothetical protein
MPEVFTLDLIDELAYELTPLIVPATRVALARVADGSCRMRAANTS